MPDSQDFEPFMNVYEVAHLFKFTPQHIRRLAESKVLPGRKYGREWRFRRSDLLCAHIEAIGMKQAVDHFAMPEPAQTVPPRRPRGRPRNP